MAEYACPTCGHRHDMAERPAWDRDPEEWRAVVGYEGLYEVSSYGQVRNRRGSLLTQRHNEWGYMKVGLFRAGEGQKTHSVHRLVAMAWHPPVEGKTFVNHINSDKTDNRPANLEWVNRHDNMEHAMAAGRAHASSNPSRGWKLSNEDVEKLKARSAAGETSAALAREYGMNATYIRKVLKGSKRRAHG